VTTSNEHTVKPWVQPPQLDARRQWFDLAPADGALLRFSPKYVCALDAKEYVHRTLCWNVRLRATVDNCRSSDSDRCRSSEPENQIGVNEVQTRRGGGGGARPRVLVMGARVLNGGCDSCSCGRGETGAIEVLAVRGSRT